MDTDADYSAYIDSVIDLVNMQNAYENEPGRHVDVDAAVEYAEDAFAFETGLEHVDVTTYVDGENILYGIDGYGDAGPSSLEPLLTGYSNPVIYHKRQENVDTPNFSVLGCNDTNREMDDILMLAAAMRRSRFEGATVTVLSNDGFRWMTMQSDVNFEGFDGPDESGEPDGAAETGGPEETDHPNAADEHSQLFDHDVSTFVPTISETHMKIAVAATAVFAIVAGFVWA